MRYSRTSRSTIFVAAVAVISASGCFRPPYPENVHFHNVLVQGNPPAIRVFAKEIDREPGSAVVANLDRFFCFVNGVARPVRWMLEQDDPAPDTHRFEASISPFEHGPSISIEQPAPNITRVTFDCNTARATAVEMGLSDQGERVFGVTECPSPDSIQPMGFDNRKATMLYGVGDLCPHSPYANARAPFFFTDRGFGVAVRSDAVGQFKFNRKGHDSVHFNASRATLDIITGRTPADILAAYIGETGPPIMPPDWAFGAAWWRSDPHDRPDGLPNAQQIVLSDMRELAQRSIPATMMFLDRPYGSGKFGWGNFDFDSSFPDPGGMIRDLKAGGIEPLVWVANRAANSLRQEASSRGFIPFDFRDHEWPALSLDSAEARDFLSQKLDIFARMGIRGFKIDRGDENEMPGSVVNRNPPQFAGLAASVLRSHFGDDHLLIARNATDSMLRTVGIWGGDTEANFEGLRRSLVHALRSGLIGYSFWGSDTAGFKGAASKDLWARWLEFSAFSPLMEVHLCRSDSLLWRDFDDELLAIVSAQAAQHHLLIPSVRTAVFTARTSGVPVMRPLFFDYPDDPRALSVTDEYLYGPSLLVAPVVTENSRSRTVYLPPGTWFRFDAPQRAYSGGASYEVSAQLGEIPVFVKTGSVIPLGDIVRGNSPRREQWQPSLQLHLFHGGETSGTYEYYDGSTLQHHRYVVTGRRVEIERPRAPAQVSVKIRTGEHLQAQMVPQFDRSSSRRPVRSPGR